MKTFGYELILDLSECSTEKFSREGLTEFFVKICDLIDMKREDLHFWDYIGYEDEIPYDQPHLVGTTAVQFITTSNIIVHTLDLLNGCFVNIFTCKEFDKDIAEKFTCDFFNGVLKNSHFVKRGDGLCPK